MSWLRIMKTENVDITFCNYCLVIKHVMFKEAYFL